MARIYRVSGYMLDTKDRFHTEKEVEEITNYFGAAYDIDLRQVHAEGSVDFILDDDSPMHKKNCDMAEYERLFIDNKPVNFDKDKVIVGRVYKHFKGNILLVIAVSRNTERINDVSVVYECEDGRIWNRPYNMFVSKVDKKKYPNAKQEYRFELTDELWEEKH